MLTRVSANGPRGSPRRRRGGAGLVELLRLSGVPVRAGPGLVAIAALVGASFWLRFSRAFGALAVAMALVATVLFLGSILVHELAHAAEARRRGLAVRDIRLEVFGGATRVTTEIARPRDELFLAVVGPWASIVLACAFGLVAWAAGEAGVAAVGEVAGVLAWLGALVGAFNLLPAAPLDGGRVLEAVVWWRTGDRTRAARVATGAGRVLGGGLAALGVFAALFVEQGFVEGAWLVLLGWFLYRSAADEWWASQLRHRLEGRRARELTVWRPSVAPDERVEAARERCHLAGDADAALVAGPGGVEGVFLPASADRLEHDERWSLPVEKVMAPLATLPSLEGSAPAAELLTLAGEEPVVVLEGGEVRSVVTAAQLQASLERLLARLGEPPPGEEAPPPQPPPPEATPRGGEVASSSGEEAPPGRSPRVLRLGLLAASLAVVVSSAAVVPLPLVEISPGPALDVPPLVVTNAPTRPVAGQLLLTSVRLDAPSALGALRALLEPHHGLTWGASLVPAGIDPADYEAAQRLLFEDSVQVASAVAFREAGYDVRIEGGGALVLGVGTGGPADGALEVGDVVRSLDGHPVGDAAALAERLAATPVGSTVVLGVRRDGRLLRVEVEPARSPTSGLAVLDIVAGDAAPLVELPFDVAVSRSDLAGPSAGLMLALSVYALVTGADLTRGGVVAGTGTIDATGAVGPVGGVAEKVVAASRAGASVFLVPSEEAAAAREAARGLPMRVVGIDRFSGALGALGAPAASR